MLKVKLKKAYVKGSKLQIKRGKSIQKLHQVILLLQKEEKLPKKYNDHALVGDWVGHRECHIEPDWLLIYKIEKDELLLVLCHTGTHSDLFE